MKVRNFAFFGVMASILSVGGANAAGTETVIASQAYVDAVANTKQPTLQNTHITDNQSGQFITDITATNGQITVTRGNAPATDLTDYETSQHASDTYQPIISDLDTIRSGAQAGATALQSSDIENMEDVRNKKNATLVTMDSGQKKIESVADYRQIDANEYAARKALAQDFESVKKAIDTVSAVASDAASKATTNETNIATNATNIANKVTKNADITAGTGTKITYDAKGLVTGSTTLAASDIPNLSETYELVRNKSGDSLITAEEGGKITAVATGDTDKYATTKALSEDFTKVKKAIELASYDDSALAGRVSANETNIANKVTKNADITAGTGTKITYDAKGLVTGSTTLAVSDIPNLSSLYQTAGDYEVTANKADEGLVNFNQETNELTVAEGDDKYSSRKALSDDFTAVANAIAATSSDTGNLAQRVATNETNIATNATNIANKVTKNADITAGTGTKITYDAKGLVTGSSSLTASDIPDLSATYKLAFNDGSTTGSGEAVTSVTQTAGKVDATKAVLHYNKAMEYKLPNYTTGKTAEQFVASECSAENPCVLTIVGMDSNGQPNYEWTQMAL